MGYKNIVQMKYAAFVMSYHRSESIVDVIDKLNTQTLPPDIILIVDNSSDSTVRDTIALNECRNVEYLSMGYNAGPAGAAFAAVRELRNRGYDWVMVSGDDTKHPSNDVAERILNLVINREGEIGVAAGVGHLFDWGKGQGKVIDDEFCSGCIDVDYVAGGSCMMINTNVAHIVGYHDPELFFGWEELDFCLRIRKAGFRIVVDGELMREYRSLWGTDSSADSRAYAMRKSNGGLARQYYGVRNSIYVLVSKHRIYQAGLRVSAKSIIKSVYSYKWGIRYGLKSTRYLFTGLSDGWQGKMGRRFSLGA